jgi:lysophospholipase L1-like esterase
MEKKKTNRFGRVDDFAALEPHDLQDFNRRCDLVSEKRSGFSAPVRDVIASAKQHNVRLIFLEMPMPLRHRKVFYSTPSWNRLQGYLKQLAASENITYLEASDWVKDDALFEDATHLNPGGAKIFSAQLAGAISNIP